MMKWMSEMWKKIIFYFYVKSPAEDVKTLVRCQIIYLLFVYFIGWKINWFLPHCFRFRILWLFTAIFSMKLISNNKITCKISRKKKVESIFVQFQGIKWIENWLIKRITHQIRPKSVSNFLISSSSTWSIAKGIIELRTRIRLFDHREPITRNQGENNVWSIEIKHKTFSILNSSLEMCCLACDSMTSTWMV